MKTIVIPKDINEIKESKPYCDAYLIGIKNLSVNMNMYIDIKEINDIIKIIGNKELFICLNKNIFNNEIDKLKNIMLELNNYKIKGIFYYDVGVLNIYKKLKLNYELVWASNHASTNYNTINYWYNEGANYCLISSDITLNDIIEIRKKTNSKLIVPIFGYQTMFNSKRHIIKNYLDYFHLEDHSTINYIEKEEKSYPIIDNNIGTTVYSNNILNVIKEYNNLKVNNIDYCIINSFLIDTNIFINILKVINNINDKNNLDIHNKINELFKNIDTGFFYRDTVTKVKNNEK